MSNEQVLHDLAIALVVMLGACALVGQLIRYVGQPPVVGQMIAGVCLGPSLLGKFLPGVQQFLFPDHLMGVLFAISQLGLGLYMFTVGLEFEAGLLRRQAKAGISVSVAGLGAPLVLGAVVALGLLYLRPGDFFSSAVSVPAAVLIGGAALATTAFPMLARILEERRIANTPLGTLALSAGAADDAAAWILLAVVLALIGGSGTLAVVALAGGLAYAVLMLTVVRRSLAVMVRRHPQLGDSGLIWILVLALAAGLITNGIGIHAIFGGFILGAVMPRHAEFNEKVKTRVQPAVKALLLPLFFGYSGLNTEIGLLNTPDRWFIFVVIVVVAVAAKGAACYFAARLCGVNHRESLAIGSLMNSRGLMELILLNILWEAGLITPTMFTMLVLMAVVTTLMATPLFNLFYGRFLPTTHGRERSDSLSEPEPAALVGTGRRLPPASTT